MRLRNGVSRALEDEADRLLRESLAGVTSRSAKSDILTEWKYEDRISKEVYTSTGFADPAVRKGMYRRSWNRRYPHLNSRDGFYPSKRVQNGLDSYVGDGDHADGDE
jgi:hypothetical protein